VASEQTLARAVLTSARLAALAAVLAGRGAARQAAAAALAGLWLYPTLRRNCAWHGPVLTSFATDSREVWLTIDDGPSGVCTEMFLEILAAEGARASFFCVGSRVARRPSLARAVAAAGHTLENHTQTHPAGSWWAASPRRVAREISTASDTIEAATGRRPRFFRSPVGMNGPWVHRAAARAGLRVAGWSAAGGDGCRVPPSIAAGRILDRLGPGGIVVLHEGDRPRQRALTLRLVLEGIRARGLRAELPGVLFSA